MENVKLLDNEELQRLVDYSFGDQSGVLGGVPGAYMKEANVDNIEFQMKLRELYKLDSEKVITLFIDNIRLYRRPIEYSDWQHLKPISGADRVWLDQFENEDLLSLLGVHIAYDYPKFKFHIFTAFEDTPLDDYIWGKIPPNVLSINAANAVIFGGKVHSFPHGIERKMYEGYDHHEILKHFLQIKAPVSKLLLICHRDDTGARGSIKDMFRNKEWVTVAPQLNYREYLVAIKEHKFVLCPSGNGIESARNWETLYMGRTPVFKRHPYLEEMFKDFPAIFVDDFSEITEELLLNYKLKPLDREKLDLDYWFNKATV